MVHSFKSPGMKIRPMPNGDMLKENFNMDGNGNFEFGPNEELLGGFFPRQKKLGLKIQDTEEGGNVKIIDVEDSSAAQKAGLKKDDIITEIKSATQMMQGNNCRKLQTNMLTLSKVKETALK